MALEPHAQFLEAAKRSHRVLVALPHAAGLDEVGGALALARALRAMGKTVDVVCDGFRPRSEHAMLPGADAILPELGGVQHFTITLPIKEVKLRDLAYTVTEDELRITLTPQTETWNAADVRATAGAYRYDLAITVGSPDLEHLGSVYRAAPGFWTSVPVVNIDHAAANERFGAIQLVDLGAVSVSEVVYGLLLGDGAKHIDGPTATALLAGIIAKTRSFKTENVSPKTLSVAADLVARGADRERIVGDLYRTRGVGTLRLWGRALAKLRVDTAIGAAGALLTRQDFVAAGGTEEELAGILEELVAACPDVSCSYVLFEGQDGAVHGMVESTRGTDALTMLRDWKPNGSPRAARFTVPGTAIVDAERMLLEKIRKAKA